MMTSDWPRYFRKASRSQSDGRAFFENIGVTEANGYLARLDARIETLSHCHDDPAPIRIGAKDGSFYQRRIDHRLGDAFRLGITLGASHVNCDEFGGAFAAAGDLARQIFAHLKKSRFKFTRVYVAGEAIRHQDNGVAGAGVGVDAHAVEGSVDDAFEHRPQRRSGQLGIGHQIYQHRRHIGLDHAGTLGDAGDNRITDLTGKVFRIFVCGHDRLGGELQIIRL